MPAPETAFLDEILALASAGRMDAVVRSAQRHTAWLLGHSPTPREGEPYGRLPLHSDARGELMLAGWHADERCAPHDHGDAHGIVIVIAGRFTETRYTPRAGGLSRADEISVVEGGVARISAGLIHDMRCDAAGVTLHVYVPAIARMRVYDFVQRCTWLVDDSAGAWIPRDDQHVIGVEAWPSEPKAWPSEPKAWPSEPV